MIATANAARRTCLALTGLCILALGACDAPEPVKHQELRDSSVPIAGSTRFAMAAFSGDWIMRQSMDPASDPVSIRLQPGSADTWRLEEAYFQCPPQGTCGGRIRTGEARQTGAGRIGVQFGPEDPGRRDILVLWVDDGFRTAALGTADGSFAWILDRNRTGGADRIRAAREVMAFNGYDVTRLETTE